MDTLALFGLSVAMSFVASGLVTKLYDFLFAFYQGLLGAGLDPRTLRATFFIPTVVVPPLFIAHALIFWLLIRRPRHRAG